MKKPFFVLRFPQRRMRLCILFALCVLTVVCGGVSALYTAQEGRRIEPVFPDEIAGIPVVTRLLPEGCEGRPGIVRRINWIVIHETGNPNRGAHAAGHNAYLQKQALETPLSWHYTVDDVLIYHHLPDNEVGWHAGDRLRHGGGNKNGIGIEICINSDGDYEKALQNAQQLTAFLLRSYGLSAEHIRQHGDFMQKNCPQRLRDAGRTEEFRAAVRVLLET